MSYFSLDRSRLLTRARVLLVPSPSPSLPSPPPSSAAVTVHRRRHPPLLAVRSSPPAAFPRRRHRLSPRCRLRPHRRLHPHTLRAAAAVCRPRARTPLHSRLRQRRPRTVPPPLPLHAIACISYTSTVPLSTRHCTAFTPRSLSLSAFTPRRILL
jgi:hypothetical protein